MICELHDLPIVCQTCGFAESSYEINHGPGTHAFSRAHLVEDPDLYEPNALIPCLEPEE